jgi:hypothetical protein
LCRGAGCTDPYPSASDPLPATGAWIYGSTSSPLAISIGFTTAAMWGSTIERLNKNPVTDTFADFAAIQDCRSSIDGGSHSVANFRSDHEGGGHFLLADGSARFVTESIDLQTYRALSTIAGGEVVGDF